MVEIRRGNELSKKRGKRSLKIKNKSIVERYARNGRHIRVVPTGRDAPVAVLPIEKGRFAGAHRLVGAETEKQSTR